MWTRKVSVGGKMPNNSFMLSKADSKRFCTAIGMGAFTLALVEFLNPTIQLLMVAGVGSFTQKLINLVLLVYICI